MKRWILLIALLAFALPADGAKRMPTPEICANGIDDDGNNLVDDGCPFSNIFTAAGGGIAADMQDARTAGTITTATHDESSSGTFLKNTSHYKAGQWALDLNTDGTACDNVQCYPWMKVRVPATGNPTDNRIWLSSTPFTQASDNTGMKVVTETTLAPPPSFSWVKLTGSFTINGAGVLYGLNTSRVEMDCLALVTSSSSEVGTADPQCPGAAPETGIVFDAIGAGDSGASQSPLTWSHTVGAGSNRIIVAGICERFAPTKITGVTSSVDGAFTQLIYGASGSIWYLVNPTAGAHTITASFSEAQNSAGNSASFSGVNQSSPFSAATQTEASTTYSTTVESAPDNLILSSLCVSASNTETTTPGTNETELWEVDAGIVGTSNRISALSTKQGDSSVNVTWTVGGSNSGVQHVVSLRTPSAAGDPPVVGTPTCTSVGVTTATCEASINDSSATGYADYDTNTGAPYANSTTPTSAIGNTMRASITGLSEGTPYFYRICATNPEGTGCSTEGTFDTTTASAATVLGITTGEIAIWNQRTTKGPYRVTGDASANSPGDWTRIVNNRAAFAASPSSGRAIAPVLTSGCVTANTNTFSWPEPGNGATHWSYRLRDAAFHNLVLGITTDHAAIKAELLWISSQTFTDWGDPSGIWCSFGAWKPGDSAPTFGIVSWLSRILGAYDYIGRAAFSAGELAQIDRWFFEAADYWRDTQDPSLDSLFTDRWAGNYTLRSACSSNGKLFWVGGPESFHPSRFYNNRRGSIYRFTGTAAIYLENAGRNYTDGRFGTQAEIKTSAEMYVQEYVRFSVFPEGALGDFERRSDTLPDLGWAYSASALAQALEIADAFARSGDPSLYEYNTALGACGTTGVIADGGARTGQNRDLRFAAQSFMSYHTDVYARYHLNSGNTDFRIDGRNPRSGSSWNDHRDSYMVPFNVYFNDSFIKSAYMRTHPSAIPYPASPASSGTVSWTGESSVYPAVLFMFGQMEGLVDPYP
jgi:hypothetical protein